MTTKVRIYVNPDFYVAVVNNEMIILESKEEFETEIQTILDGTHLIQRNWSRIPDMVYLMSVNLMTIDISDEQIVVSRTKYPQDPTICEYFTTVDMEGDAVIRPDSDFGKPIDPSTILSEAEIRRQDAEAKIIKRWCANDFDEKNKDKIDNGDFERVVWDWVLVGASEINTYSRHPETFVCVESSYMTWKLDDVLSEPEVMLKIAELNEQSTKE